jgi:hypothetical protein
MDSTLRHNNPSIDETKGLNKLSYILLDLPDTIAYSQLGDKASKEALQKFPGTGSFEVIQA